MTIPPKTRRANLWLLVGLIAFALALCATVLLWMRATVRAKGGIVDPQRPAAVFYWRPIPGERSPIGLAA